MAHVFIPDKRARHSMIEHFSEFLTFQIYKESLC